MPDRSASKLAKVGADHEHHGCGSAANSQVTIVGIPRGIKVLYRVAGPHFHHYKLSLKTVKQSLAAPGAPIPGSV